jgi:hypothetical protein
MRVYQVIKDCSISFIRNGRDVGFALYVGDYFFIQPDACWIKCGIYDEHVQVDLLLKIYHNKMDLKGTKEWTWINDLNLTDPKIKQISHSRSIKEATLVNPIWGPPICKDVTIQWERDKKLSQVI